MALNFQAPGFVQPNKYEGISNVGNSLDEVYNRFLQGQQLGQRQAMQQQQMGLQQQEIARQRGADHLQYGFDPAQVNQQSMAQAQGPAMGGEDQGILALRDFLQKRKASQGLMAQKEQLGVLGQQAELGKTLAETQKLQAEAQFAPEKNRPSSGEFVARGFADKAGLAESDLTRLVQEGFDPSSSMGGLAPNALKSSQRQRFEQSMRQFVNAVLRRESGAAIPETELANYTKQYFPSFGDSEDTRLQKQSARRVAIQGLAAEGSRVPSALPQDGGRSQVLERTGKIKGSNERVAFISNDGGKSWRPK